MKNAGQDVDVVYLANFFRLLGHPMRLSIALLLLSGPKTVSFIESRLGIKQPNLSQHLAVLRDAGVLASSRKAKSVTYEIPAGVPRQLLQALAVEGTPHAREAGQAPAKPERQGMTGSITLASGQGVVLHGYLPEEEEAQVFATVSRPVRKA